MEKEIYLKTCKKKDEIEKRFPKNSEEAWKEFKKTNEYKKILNYSFKPSFMKQQEKKEVKKNTKKL